MFKLKSIISLTLPEQAIIPIIGILVGSSIAAEAFFDIQQLIFPFISFFLLVLGFNALNSIFDMYIDKLNKPKKPLLTGEMSKHEVWCISVFLYGTGLILAAICSMTIFTLALGFVLLSLLYSIPPIQLKKRFLGVNITGGLVYGVIPLLVGYSLVDLEQLSIPIALYFFVATAILSTVKDFGDYLGDNFQGVKTLPAVYGPEKAAILVSTSLLAVTFIFMLYTSIVGLTKLALATAFVVIMGILFPMYLTKTARCHVKKFSGIDTIYQSGATRIVFSLSLLMELIYALIYI